MGEIRRVMRLRKVKKRLTEIIILLFMLIKYETDD